MKIKKLYELFDSPELNITEFEIPYLKGELGSEVINKWNNMDVSSEPGVDNMANTYYFKYPVLKYLDSRKVKANDVDAIVLSGNGDVFYAQMVMSYNNNKYYMNIILKRLSEDDTTKWLVREYRSKTIDKLNLIVEDFIESCDELNISGNFKEKNPNLN